MTLKHKPRPEFLATAELCGAKITGKPDGTEPVGIYFSHEAWKLFDFTIEATQAPSAPANPLIELVESMGGKVESVDEFGMTASFPLRPDHWIYQSMGEPPAPFRIGTGASRDQLAKMVTDAAKYAIRGATMGGKDDDFDPDALVQNFIVGMLGYWTEDGRNRG